MDIATTASLGGEAFPLVIGEAMACGAPCVVTDVGDCALIVGETGTVVAPGDPEALARGMAESHRSRPRVRHRLGIAARRRVQQHFALPSDLWSVTRPSTPVSCGGVHVLPIASLSEIAP